MNRTRVAIIGGGHLGTIHARLLSQVSDAEFVAVVESDSRRAAQLVSECSCPVVSDVRQLLHTSALDAAVLAVPTSLHGSLGTELLRAGVHVLCEKPLAANVAECRALVTAAERSQRILQVGHVERFNPVWRAIPTRLGEPRFIEATREGPLTFRSLDVGVVLDLMIHDIDLILSLVRAPIVSVQALGFAWTGSSEDVAQARLIFANGCVAQLSASRISCEPARRMRIFGDDWYSHVDFGTRTGYIVHSPTERDWQTRDYSPELRKQLAECLFEEVLPRETLVVQDANPILEELRDFVSSIRERRLPRVTGQDGLAAVEVASQIQQRIRQRRFPATLRLGTRKAG